MDIIIYAASSFIIVAWSIWVFLLWQKKTNFTDSSPIRFIILLLPESYILLIALSGWSNVFFLRFDVIGLSFISIITLLHGIVQAVSLPLCKRNYIKVYCITIITHNLLSIGIILFVYIIKNYPMIGITISAFLSSQESFKLLKDSWYGSTTNPYTEEIYRIITKIAITLCGYIPITLVRIWYTSYKFRQLKNEIDTLKDKVAINYNPSRE